MIASAETWNERRIGSDISRPDPNLECRALLASLRQLADLLHAISDEQYISKPKQIAASSIGGHVRHCLDHVSALIVGMREGTVDYDRRERGSMVESCRFAAIAFLAKQMTVLSRLGKVHRQRRLRLVTIVDSALPEIELATTIGREMVFVLSHTIHHNALIAVIAQSVGAKVPERFGYAPSTIAYLESNQCAQ